MATKFLAECLISSEDELELFTQTLAPHLSAPLIIGLNGPMGSGKTTFVRCIAAALGSTDWVNSPTYAIIQSYKSPKFELLHLDLYRTQNDQDIDHLDIPSLLTDRHLAFIEWIDKTSLFDVDLMIKFEVANDNRYITLSSDKLAWVSTFK